MMSAYAIVSSGVVLLGAVFLVDSLTSWDNFAVVAAITGWAVVVTGILHMLVALGRHGGEPIRWLAIASASIVVVLVVCGWVFASFGRDWPEIASVVLMVVANALGTARKAQR